MAERFDSGIPPERPQRSRRGGRAELQAEVSLRRSGQHPYRVTVLDASPHGCRVELVERPALDEHVWVKFDGLEAIEGLVCWVDGHVAGLEFVKPIHPAVFDGLVGRLR